MGARIPNTQTGALIDDEQGTNDTFTEAGTFYGDAYKMFDSSRGGLDTLIGTVDLSNYFYGDASQLFDESRGGRDRLIGADNAFNQFRGDAYQLFDDSRGGSDKLIGGGINATNLFYGDADLMYDNTKGGPDTLIGGDKATNLLYGDAYLMFHNAFGGNDTLIGGDAIGTTNFLVGDAGDEMSDYARGGKDTLTGGVKADNTLIGDTYSMFGHSRGGKDELTGGDNTVNTLIGDASQMSDYARCGRDILVSGTGTDLMWGDAQDIFSPATVVTAADTFVFLKNSRNDTIYDFRRTDGDRIDVSAYGFHSMADMTILADAGNTKIAFTAKDSVTLVGIDPGALRASSFIFAT